MGATNGNGKGISGLMGRARVRTRVRVPLRTGEGTFFTFHGLVDDREHVAIAFGDYQSAKAPLVRMHSECLTGDVFLSGRCDCGEQLDEAVAKLQAESGILLYLRQEGRGIGLYNKLDAYALQLQGLDTYEANERLGLGRDLRDYGVAAQMLAAMGFTRIRLLSNNPEKRTQLEDYGIRVDELVSTGVYLKAGNGAYLRTKVVKTGHRLSLPAHLLTGRSEMAEKSGEPCLAEVLP